MKFIRLEQLKTMTGLSNSTIWRLEKNGSFPQRKKLAQRCVGWLLEDVEKWMESVNSNQEKEDKYNG